jgi:putative lipase involved disintegration of autophagic bodies
MEFKILFSFLVLAMNPFLGHSQIKNFKEKFELPSEIKETSGLLLIDGKIITHNDRGDAANLYEIDSLSGNLLRTIRITNATNEDWEDLAEDENHIYIGDFGNNDGNRTNLRIYKI